MHFIRLLRPINLVIILITMYGTGWFLEYYTDNIGEVWSFDFLLLTLSTMMIAGAGNIINDYFDVKADRVNKPNRVIIGKYVKRRVAIISHWILNFIAFSIAVYLSWKFETFWYVFAHFMAINFLWFYSTSLKRSFLLGNVVVAALTALVPILVGFYFYHLIALETPHSTTHYSEIHDLIGRLIWIIAGLAAFAFILNLAREIIKDIEDVEGDKLLKARTIPIVIGKQNSRYIVALIITVGVILLGGVLMEFGNILFSHLILALVSLIVMVSSIIVLFAVTSQSGTKLANNLLKVAMITGLMIPVYIRLIEAL